MPCLRAVLRACAALLSLSLCLGWSCLRFGGLVRSLPCLLVLRRPGWPAPVGWWAVGARFASFWFR
eukprot:3745250-Alexandrium_andersonii.AAC.1